MKAKLTYPALLTLSSLLLSSCGEKEKPSSTTGSGEEKTSLIESVTEKVEEAAETVAKKVTNQASAEERAAKLGFARFLPKNTEGLVATYRANELTNKLRGSALGGFIEQTLQEQGINIDEQLEQSPEAGMALSLFAEESFVAMGDKGGETLVNYVKIINSMNYAQVKSLINMAALSLKGEEPEYDPDSEVANYIKGILNDPNAGIGTLENLHLPPLTIGFKVSDEEQRNQLAELLQGGIQQSLGAGEEAPLDPVTIEKGSITLEGIKFSGKKLAALIEDEARAEMTPFVENEANVTKLIEALEKLEVIFTTGVIEDYVIISIAQSEEDIAFAESANDSILATDEFAFVDSYLGKDIHFLSYGDKETLAGLISQEGKSIDSYIHGVNDGLKETDVFGDTSDIQTLLAHVNKLYGDIYSRYQAEAFGAVGFLEDGFKIESHGGSNQPAFDMKTKHTLNTLAKGENVFIFTNWVNDADASELGYELLDSLGETAYLIAKQASQLEIEDEDFEQFAQGFGMVDNTFSADLKELWTAVRGDFSSGVGGEQAFIIDLEGGLPKVPSVPAPILEKGKVPRITYAAPVVDRAKLGQSWDRINTSLTNILKNVSEQSGTEIPMQEPLSSNANGSTSYFFTTIPFTTNDFMPNVTVSDEYFFASTSKSLAESLGEQVKNGTPVDRQGFYFEMNFSALNTYATSWLQLVDENQDAIFADNEFGKEDFVQNKPIVEKTLEALKELDQLTIHVREEDGENRGTLHLKTK